MSAIIKTTSLGKCYVLNHQQNESYSTLRDSISNKARSLIRGSGKQTREEFWALRDVNFEIGNGDRVGIIGRNGAGKSTLLKILSRIVAPTTGRIEINGRIASLLEVGTGFHPELSGRENIFLNGSILGMSRQEIKQKFDEIVAFSEVEKFLDTPVKRYSSGMYVRLAFSVAAHLDPEILIVDEVLAVGDAQFQRKCLGKMQDVSANEGRTVLFVSHNMSAIQKLCNKGILLKQGQLITQGEIDHVVNHYLMENESAKPTYKLELPADHLQLPGYAYKMQIENENGEPLSEVMIGKYWQVRVFFKLNRDVENVIVALGIQTSTDQAVRTSWSESKNYFEGEYEAVFKSDEIILTTGIYKLVVGLSSSQRAFYYNEKAGDLVISEASSLTDNERVLNTQSGLLLNPMEIQIIKK